MKVLIAERRNRPREVVPYSHKNDMESKVPSQYMKPVVTRPRCLCCPKTKKPQHEHDQEEGKVQGPRSQNIVSGVPQAVQCTLPVRQDGCPKGPPTSRTMSRQKSHLSQIHNDMSAFMSKYKKVRLHKLHKDGSLGKPADWQVERLAISISKNKLHKRDATPTTRQRSEEHLPRILQKESVALRVHATPGDICVGSIPATRR